jgi:fumarate reductase subunit C
MSESQVYTSYHPRWLRRPVSTYWWLQKWSYFRFILREGSCMFVAWFVVYLLLLVNAVSEGPGSYARFIEWSATPWLLALNVVSFLFIAYHAVTFFQAAPQAMVVHVGRRRVPGYLVMAGHYVAWAVTSVFVAWLLLG